MRIVALADIHSSQPKVPDGDMLLVAGDLTGVGSLPQMAAFASWLRKLPHPNKVLIAGNHDFCLQRVHEREEAESMLGGDGIVYLRDQSVHLGGLHIYGSPWQPWFHDWAFNLERGQEIRQKWDQIPERVDILLVHGPPRGYGDRVPRGFRGEHAERVGCEDLLDAIKRQRPRYAFYGHIHEDPGTWTLPGGTQLLNCSVGERGKPVVVDIEPRRPEPVVSFDPTGRPATTRADEGRGGGRRDETRGEEVDPWESK